MHRYPYHGHRFPPEIIRQAVWLYLRFTLSFRDVEDLLAERGLDVSYETIRSCPIAWCSWSEATTISGWAGLVRLPRRAC
jgi:transposase-like protein